MNHFAPVFNVFLWGQQGGGGVITKLDYFGVDFYNFRGFHIWSRYKMEHIFGVAKIQLFFGYALYSRNVFGKTK